MKCFSISGDAFTAGQIAVDSFRPEGAIRFCRLANNYSFDMNYKVKIKRNTKAEKYVGSWWSLGLPWVTEQQI